MPLAPSPLAVCDPAVAARLEADIAEVCGVINAAHGRLVDLISSVIAYLVTPTSRTGSGSPTRGVGRSLPAVFLHPPVRSKRPWLASTYRRPNGSIPAVSDSIPAMSTSTRCDSPTRPRPIGERDDGLVCGELPKD